MIDTNIEQWTTPIVHIMIRNVKVPNNNAFFLSVNN